MMMVAMMTMTYSTKGALQDVQFTAHGTESKSRRLLLIGIIARMHDSIKQLLFVDHDEVFRMC